MYKKIKRRIKYALLNISYVVSKLVPKRKTLWVFGSMNCERFRDNSKYFFIYVSRVVKEIEAVWISKEDWLVDEIVKAGFIAYHRWSLKGMWKTVRAKFVFYDCSPNSVNKWIANGIVFQMWHGLPMKKIGWDLKGRKETKMYKNIHSKGIKRLFYKIFMPYLFRKEDWIVVTSPFFQEIMSSVFDVPKERVIVTGHPRNDVFEDGRFGTHIDMDLDTYRNISTEKLVNKKKIIMYMPTLRKSRGKGEDREFKDILVLDVLNKKLSEWNAVLVLKHHLGSEASSKIKEYDNILVYDALSDAQPVLDFVDLLITDYSGVYFDFLLFDKPIIFYAYDLKDYVDRIGLYLNYETDLMGYVAKSFIYLVECIERVWKGEDDFSRKRKSIVNTYFKYTDSNSSSRLVKLIFDKYKIERRL